MLADGIYNDGRTAARRTVRVRLGADGIDLAEVDGGPVDRWRYDALALAEDVYPGRPARLFVVGGAARLVVADPAFVKALFARAPRLRKGRKADTSWRLVLSIALAGVLTLAGLGYAVLAAAPLVALHVVGPQTEASIGTALADGMFRDVPRCRGADGEAALQRMTDRLMQAAPVPRDRIKVRVLNLADVNAFALPGGELVVLRGLIDKSSGPDAVAGVLAHEIGHAIERHPLQQISRALGLSLLINLVTGGTGDVVAQLVSFGGLVALMRYSRDAEREADGWALKLLQGAGTSTKGLADFFGWLREEEKRRGSLSESLAFLSSHPASQEREQVFRDAAEPRPPVLTDAQWKALKGLCEGAGPAKRMRGLG